MWVQSETVFQVERLPVGLQGACLHSGLPSKQRNAVLSQVIEGRVNILLLSPEAVISGSVVGELLRKKQLPPIAFACIDEVHCISEWSHNFRPSYLQVCKVMSPVILRFMSACSARCVCTSCITLCM